MIKYLTSSLLLFMGLNAFAQTPIKEVNVPPKPEFDFNEYIEKNINQTYKDIYQGKTGIIKIDFIVSEFGYIKEVTIDSDSTTVSMDLEKQFTEAFSNMRRWIPGKKKKKPCDIWMTYTHIIEKTDTPYYYRDADILPQYIGGLDSLKSFMERNVIIPKVRIPEDEAKFVKVKLKFTEKGELESFEQIKYDSNYEFYFDAIGVALKKMPAWGIGKIEGVPVKMEGNLCFLFSYSDTGGYKMKLSPEHKFSFNGFLDGLEYPEEARYNDISGIVYIGFDVSEEGQVINIHPADATSRLGYGLEEEAIRVIKMAKRMESPMICFHKTIKKYTIPIHFELE